jgi:hypothetical protein
MRTFLTCGRELKEPSPHYAYVEWLERLGHEVFVQSARGGRKSIARDMAWISKHAEAVAFVHGLDMSNYTYAAAFRKVAECYDCLIMLLPPGDRIEMCPSEPER